MTISYVNLAAQWNDEKSELIPIINAVFESGAYIGGKNVEVFENLVAEYCGVKGCAALNSGTDALMSGLLALGVCAGDEVITPPNSFVASTAAIVHLGAKPVFADVQDDQLIDPIQIEKLITNKTKAIMPVHLTGKMSNMDAIKSVSEKYSIPIIEDAAQSIGSRLKDRLSGTLGSVGCFSAHPLKNLNACGDAGFLISDNEELIKTVKSYRNHGFENRNLVTRFGVVSRLDELQAAILIFRLRRLPEVINKRRLNAKIYQENLNKEFVYMPEEGTDEFNSYHTFVIQVPYRDELAANLKEFGVQTAIHYPTPIHLQPAAKALGYLKGDFPIAESQARRILSLPIHQYLKKDEVYKTVELINYFFEK